jgi:hypothetical protein
MEGEKHSNQETWDRLVLLLIARPLAGWQEEFNEIVRREIERLAVLAAEVEGDE